MPDPLADSYAFCRKFARRTAKNVYYSFLGLPADRFDAMCVLYSYMRICDDIGDDERQSVESRLAALDLWSDEVCRALDEPTDENCHSTSEPQAFDALVTGRRVLPALGQMVATFQIPHEYLLDVIAGMRADLEADQRCAQQADAGPLCLCSNFDELAAYCYRVAGVVGRCCIHIWGFNDPRALEIAVDCGLAFQLTNILRDLAEDADNGRVYLPADELQQFGYQPEQLQQRVRNDAFLKLMAFQTQRAEQYYTSARELFDVLDPCGRPVLQAMMKLYGGILSEIRSSGFDVFSRRVSLPAWKKLLIAAGAVARQQLQKVRA